MASPGLGRAVSHVGRGTVEGALAMATCIGVGHGLELLASQQRFYLHRVPLGPNGGADPMASPMPFGEHGWMPVPLCVLDALLLWNSAGRWHSTSWWGSCNGAIWGQLQTLASCVFGILPSIFAIWLLHMPWMCTPMSGALLACAASSSLAGLLFWTDCLPLLPRARATDAHARGAVRRMLLNLLHVAFQVAMTATYEGDATCALCPKGDTPVVDPRYEPGTRPRGLRLFSLCLPCVPS